MRNKQVLLVNHVQKGLADLHGNYFCLELLDSDGFVDMIGAFDLIKDSPITLLTIQFLPLGKPVLESLNNLIAAIPLLENPNIKCLNLSSNNLYILGLKGLSMLLEAVEKSNIKIIELSRNEFEKFGLDAETFIKILGRYTTKQLKFTGTSDFESQLRKIQNPSPSQAENPQRMFGQPKPTAKSQHTEEKGCVIQ